MRTCRQDNAPGSHIKYLGLSTLLLLSIGLADVAFAEEIAIVRTDHPAKRIKIKKLKKMFLGKIKKWPNGEKITIAILRGGSVHDAFIRKYVGKTPKQFTNYWRKMVFTGRGKMPKKFTTQEKLVEFVAKTRGAIGYIDSAIPAKEVKELLIQ